MTNSINSFCSFGIKFYFYLSRKFLEYYDFSGSKWIEMLHLFSISIVHSAILLCVINIFTFNFTSQHQLSKKIKFLVKSGEEIQKQSLKIYKFYVVMMKKLTFMASFIRNGEFLCHLITSVKLLSVQKILNSLCVNIDVC